MIYFEDWKLRVEGQVIARQFDNLTRTFTVVGDIPDGWEWAVLVQVGKAMDIIPLKVMEEGLSTVLTARQLSIGGYYQIQLRATQGERVKHTNVIGVYVSASLSGDEKWPEVPSAFTELERRNAEYASKAGMSAAAAESSVGEARAAAEEAGKSAVLARQIVRQGNTLCANALKDVASGVAVRLDDVSPLEHKINVKVSGVDDPAAVTVHAHGKNLYNNVDYGLINPQNAIVFSATKTETGYFLTGSAGNSYWVLVPLGSLAELGGKLVTLSADINGTPFAPNLVMCDKAYGNRSVLYGDNFANFTGVISFSVPQASEYPDGYIVTVRLNGDANNDPTAVVTYDNIQVEIGDTATEYEPYIEPVTYPVAEDGTCEVASNAPSMTLLTDTAGVVVDCEYNRDINKAFDQLVQAIISMGGNV